MMRNQKIYTHSVSSPDEFISICKNIMGQSLTLFRGQTNDYGSIIPSIFRLKDEVDLDRDLIIKLFIDCYSLGNWEEYQQHIIEENKNKYEQPVDLFSILNQNSRTILDRSSFYFLEIPPFCMDDRNYIREDFIRSLTNSIKTRWDTHADALFQHYGIPSRALDITYEPLIALWFATHKYVTDYHGKAKYIPIEMNSCPVVYVFNPSIVETVDLREVYTNPYVPSDSEEIPYFGLRSIAQKGGLIFGATKENPDMWIYLSHIIKVSSSIWNNKELLNSKTFTEENLFPRRKEDIFYHTLLEQCINENSKYNSLYKYIPIFD